MMVIERLDGKWCLVGMRGDPNFASANRGIRCPGWLYHVGEKGIP